MRIAVDELVAGIVSPIARPCFKSLFVDWWWKLVSRKKTFDPGWLGMKEYDAGGVWWR
jgi:hypothetical protein